MEHARSELKERHGRLVSSGAPKVLDFLNGLWRRSECDIATMPYYCKFDEASGGDQPLLHLYFAPQLPGWRIAQNVNAQQVLAEAFCDAAHPNTITKGSWRLLLPLNPSTPPMLQSCPGFDTSADGPNTPEQPFLIEEIGRDFFTRAQPRKQVIWFECPSTGEVYHSGAKKAGQQSDKPGNRYCPICNRCFSANNFKSQHMKSHARFLSSVKTSPQPDYATLPPSDYSTPSPNFCPPAVPSTLAPAVLAPAVVAPSVWPPPPAQPLCPKPSAPPELASLLSPRPHSTAPAGHSPAATMRPAFASNDVFSRAPPSSAFDFEAILPLVNASSSPFERWANISSLLNEDEPTMMSPMLYDLPSSQPFEEMSTPVHRSMSFDPIEEMIIAF